MSVIVKTMKMPNSCASCPLLEYDEFAIDGYKDHWCNALDIGMSIDEQPTVDAVPVIRCKDCRNKEDCQWYYYSEDDYGYCKWAERKPPQVNPEMVKALKDRIEKQRGEHDTAD